jgi:hypothetical protein
VLVAVTLLATGRPGSRRRALTLRMALTATLDGAVVFLPLFAGLVAIAKRVDRAFA